MRGIHIYNIDVCFVSVMYDPYAIGMIKLIIKASNKSRHIVVNNSVYESMRVLSIILCISSNYKCNFIKNLNGILNSNAWHPSPASVAVGKL